ncbi:MAG TPA: type I restriction endonuclease subunit S [Halomonas sp.]|nr:type I restriction endonuclease subunit S [Halomonas sp.]
MKRANERDVLICVVGATAGKLNLGIDCAIGRSVAAIRPLGGVQNVFIYQYLRTQVTSLRKGSTGSAQGVISKTDLHEVTIPFPPLAEQKIIADKLDTLLAQVENTKARLERIPQILKRFRQSVLAAAVSGRLTEEWRGSSDLIGWEAGELGRFVEKPRYGSSAKSQKSGDIPVLRMGNLQDGKLDWADLVYTSDPEEIEKYRLEPGDVLFNRTNSPELVGKTSIFKGERDAIYAGYLIKIKCLPSLNAEFLNYQLNSPKAKDYCKAVKSDGVSQSNINAKKLAAYPLSCPPIEEQTEIVRRVDQLFAHADRIEQQVNNALARINNLAQSILAKAFRGELTEQWRKDNPELITGENSAEALLDRIKAERAAMKPAKKSRQKRTTA